MTDNNEEEVRLGIEPPEEVPQEQQSLRFEEPLTAEDMKKEIEEVEEEAKEELDSSLNRVLRSTNLPDPEDSGTAPAWVKLPTDDKFMFPQSRTIYFLRFRAEWTDTPSKGERQCICWPITVGDKKLAAQRAMGDGNRIVEEMCMRFIRVIDGEPTSETGSAPGNIEAWWNEVGEKVRAQIMRIFTRAHVLDDGQQSDFLENCIAVRTGG